MKIQSVFEKIRHLGMTIVFFGALFIIFWSIFIIIAERIHLVTATSAYFLINYIVSPIVMIWLIVSVGWLIFLITVPLIARIAQALKS